MIEFSEVSLYSVAMHRVGNKLRDEGVSMSNKEITLDFSTEEALSRYFFHPFTNAESYQFRHDCDMDLNKVYRTCKDIFNDSTLFVEKSQDIARVLYEASTHPQVKEGELYVAIVNDIIVEGEVCDAIGIFKSDNQDIFLEIGNNENGLAISTRRGIDINSKSYACLVLNTEMENGYRVFIASPTSGTYWKNEFLQVKPREDAYYQTHTYMDVCKRFVKEVFNATNGVDRADQVAMLSNTAEFFKENETFNDESFEKEVMQQPEIIESFREYKDKYQTKNNVEIAKNFEIAKPVVKSLCKGFKSVIKLDKNFHIYLHGNTDLVEKGYDENLQKSYYKLYYDAESM